MANKHGVRWQERWAREQIFLTVYEQLKEAGAVMIREGKELSMKVEVEGTEYYVNMEFKTKRPYQSGLKYSPAVAHANAMKEAFERELFGVPGKKRVAASPRDGINTMTLAEFNKIRVG